MIRIAPSLLAADFANLEREVQMLNRSEADWIHVDVMDGVFVPNLSLGLPIVEAVKRHSRKPLDVHLMIVQPERYVEAFRKAGADLISVHLEASPHLHRTVQHIKSLGCKAGVALNPHTPVESLLDILPDLDLVCLMSVNPGFGGQQFIPGTFDRVQRLRQLIQKTQSSALIEIDGGVNETNGPALAKAGADVLVAGHFVFSSPSPEETIKKLRQIGQG